MELRRWLELTETDGQLLEPDAPLNEHVLLQVRPRASVRPRGLAGDRELVVAVVDRQWSSCERRPRSCERRLPSSDQR
jgi:hypothetical protein